MLAKTVLSGVVKGLTVLYKLVDIVKAAEYCEIEWGVNAASLLRILLNDKLPLQLGRAGRYV